MVRNWPHDLSGLQDIAQEEIIPEWRQTRDDPTRQRPTHEWLNDHGYSNLRWILEEKCDMNVPTFFSMFLGIEKRKNRWATDDPETIKLAEEYLDREARFRDWKSSTKSSKRCQLNRVFRGYVTYSDDSTGEFVALANDVTRRTEVYDRFVEVIYKIKQEAKSDESAYQSLRAVQRFYESLDRRGLIEYNPTDKIQEEFRWDLSSDGSTPLTDDQIASLWETADTLEDYLLIIGYVIWGVRRQELPSIHRSQFDFDGESTTITFEDDDRKNGSGTVDILFGEQYIHEQLDRLESHSQWQGHLLPKSDDKSQPMRSRSAADQFKQLCASAGVIVDGDPATPNNGRAVWHNINAEAEAFLQELEYLDMQDLEDNLASRRYHDPSTKEETRQMLYLERFKSILPAEAYNTEFVFLRDAKEQYNLNLEFPGSDE